MAESDMVDDGYKECPDTIDMFHLLGNAMAYRYANIGIKNLCDVSNINVCNEFHASYADMLVEDNFEGRMSPAHTIYCNMLYIHCPLRTRITAIKAECAKNEGWIRSPS